MHLSKLMASLGLLAAAILLPFVGPSLAAQGLRISDPSNIPDTGQGWQVEPVTRALTAVFPVQTLPGSMPVNLCVRMNGSCAIQCSPLGTTHFPIYSSVHFGYVSDPVVNSTLTAELQSRNDFVLEDGTLYKSSDFGSFNYDRKGRLLAQFGLSANPLFPFIHVSNDGRVKAYAAVPADLGRWADPAAQLNPAGFGVKPGGRPYLVLLTTQRARIFTYIPEFQAYVPLLWLDPFGHAIAFQWTRHTSNLPSGYDGVLAVEVRNRESGKGLLVQWPQGGGDGLQDVLRADFIGVDAPALQVRGWPGAGSFPAGVLNPGAVSWVNQPPRLGGPVFRPQALVLAPQGQLPAPAWLAAGQPLPDVVPGAPDQDSTPQTWSFGYDSAQSTVTSITEPNGLETRFTSELCTSKLAFQTDWGAQTIAYFGIRSAVSTDPVNALTRTRSWVWDTSLVSEKVLLQQDYFGDAPIRETRMVFHSTGRAGDNGAIQSEVVRDPVTKAIARRTDIVLTAGGFKGLSTLRQSITTSYPDPAGSPRPTAPSTVETLTYDQPGLTVVKDVLTAGGLPVQTRDFGYRPSPGFLLPSLLAKVTDTHYGLAQPFLPTLAKDRGERRPGPAANPRPSAELAPARTLIFQYDPTGSRITRQELDAGVLGKVGQSRDYDPDGRPARIAPTGSAASWSQELTYDPAGSGSVASTTTTYAATLGKPGTATVAATVTAFDTLGRPVTATDARGVTTTTTWDTRGRLLRQEVQGLPPVTFNYSPDGATVTRTQGAVSTSTVTDLFGRTIAQTAADGTGVRMGYDAAGRVAWKQAVADDGTRQEPATWSYDLLDRVTRTTNPGGAGAVTSFAYAVSPANPAWARTVTTLDPAHLKAVTISDRDLLGQQVWRRDPLGVTTAQSYDGLGNRVRVVTREPGSGRSQTRAFTFDGLSRLLVRTEPETGTTTYGNFDALNQPTTVTDASGRTRTQAFDGLGRRVAEANGADALAWSYTGLNLTSSSSRSTLGTVTQEFRYEGPAGSLSREGTTQPGLVYATTYAYDAEARLAAITYPSGRVIRYGYDPMNRITRLQNNGTPLVTEVGYSPWGPRQRITFASTAFSDGSRKDGGTHLDRWTLGYRPGGALADYTANPRIYGFDPAERLIQAAEWSLTPDPEGRLVGASAPDLSLIDGAFRHDGFGNNNGSSYDGAASVPLTGFTIDPGRDNLTPGLDAKGALTGWTYGNPSNGEAQTVGLALGARAPQLGLTWDGLGRLAQVSNGLTGTVERYQYAPSGLRAARRDSLDPSRDVIYAYAGGTQLLTEFDANLKARDVVYLGGRAIAEIDAQGIHELHPDHLGTPRIITSGATGQIEGRQSFGAYGESLAAGTAGYLPMTGYAGHLQTEPNGLIYMKGRFYSPVWHRFVNSDQGADSNSLNQIAFCGGNPMMYVDPSGLSFFGSLWDGLLSFFGGGSGKGNGQGGSGVMLPIEGIGGGGGGSKSNQKSQTDPQTLSSWVPGAKWAPESTIDVGGDKGQSYHYGQPGFWYKPAADNNQSWSDLFIENETSLHSVLPRQLRHPITTGVGLAAAAKGTFSVAAKWGLRAEASSVIGGLGWQAAQIGVKGELAASIAASGELWAIFGACGAALEVGSAVGSAGVATYKWAAQ